MRLFFFLLGWLCVIGAVGKDATQLKYTLGNDLVTATVRKLQDTCIFPNDFLFLRRLAYLATKDGNDLKSLWNTDVGRNGIWNITAAELEQIQKSKDATKDQIKNILGIDVNALSWKNNDLTVPINNIVAASLYASLKGNIPTNITDQADYWVKNFNPSGTPEKFIKAVQEMPKSLPPGMDLIFIIDSSYSIGARVFENVRFFLKMLLPKFKDFQGSMRVGIIVFSAKSDVALPLTSDINLAMEKVANLPYYHSSTNIGAGINMAYDQFKSYGRKDLPMVAVMIGDGGDAPFYNKKGGYGDSHPDEAAEKLKGLGVTFFTIGIGNDEDIGVLKKWASSPACAHFYCLKTYQDLAAYFPDLLYARISQVSAVIPDTQACVNTSTSKDQYIYYQVPVDLDKGVTIKSKLSQGTASMYVSMKNRLPSSANYDFKAQTRPHIPGQLYISPNELKALNASKTIYASLIGHKIIKSNGVVICAAPKDATVEFHDGNPGGGSGDNSDDGSGNSSGGGSGGNSGGNSGGGSGGSSGGSSGSDSEGVCSNVELIFILDRSQSVFADFYNNNVTEFVIEMADQFINRGNNASNNFARIGVIEFAYDAAVTIPLNDYDFKTFSERVHSNVSYNDEGLDTGEPDLGKALMAAYHQFKKNSFSDNRAVVLVVNDIDTMYYKAAKDALAKLNTLVTLHMGTVFPGTHGSVSEGYQHLRSFIDSAHVFPSIEKATASMMGLIEANPCPRIPACSAIIFATEASTAVGLAKQLEFLDLVINLVNDIEFPEGYRFGIVEYGRGNIKMIRLQPFEAFNVTLNNYYRSIKSDARGKKTKAKSLKKLAAASSGSHLNLFEALDSTLDEKLYRNYSILLMGQLDKVTDINATEAAAKSLARHNANIYVLDQTKQNPSVDLWKTLTANTKGRILKSDVFDPELLYAEFSQGMISEFLENTCETF